MTEADEFQEAAADAELEKSASKEVGMPRLRDIQSRALESRDRYWSLSKSVRIENGLSSDVLTYGYSGDRVLTAIEAATASAFAGRIPVECPSPLDQAAINVVDAGIFSAETSLELADRLEPLIAELETNLNSIYEAINQEHYR